MKRLLVVILMMLLSESIVAQIEDSPHLSFMNIEIDGSAKKFVKELKKRGFEKDPLSKYAKGKMFFLNGTFAGIPDCGVHVPIEKTPLRRVIVRFPGMKDWLNLNDLYNIIENMLIEKYGMPFDSMVEFEGKEPTSNTERWNKLKAGECVYQTSFVMPKGDIWMTIGYDDLLEEGVVRLYYDDRINTANAEKEMKSDL